MIRGLLFDYGGTIDTNGLHWAVLLKQAYNKFELLISDDLFYDAYCYGERSLAINPLVKPFHNFYDTLLLKVREQFKYLKDRGLILDSEYIESISLYCYQYAKRTIQTNKPILEELSNKYPMVMVSNFYGNLKSVLEDFRINQMFQVIVESAVVGIRKPDPMIYRLGAEKLHLTPDHCMVIGDSFSKDIVPAKNIGCHTIWLRRESWIDALDVQHPDTMRLSDIQLNDFSKISGELSQFNSRFKKG